jgi:hypothetical protein
MRGRDAAQRPRLHALRDVALAGADQDRGQRAASTCARHESEELVRRTRYNNRDRNEAPLLNVASRLGISWEEGGPLDGWVFCRRRGWVPVEIKDPKREGHANEYQPSQLAFFARCKQRGSPWLVWRTEQDVLDFAGAKRVA